MKKNKALNKIIAMGGLASILLFSSGFELDIQRNLPDVNVSYPTLTNYYYRVFQNHDLLSGEWTPVMLELGSGATQSYTISNVYLTVTNSIFIAVEERSVNSPEDTDGDGIDDVYELKNSLLDGLDVSDALLDPDQDGFDNLTEYQAGTSISQSNLFPSIVITYPYDGMYIP